MPPTGPAHNTPAGIFWRHTYTSSSGTPSKPSTQADSGLWRSAFNGSAGMGDLRRKRTASGREPRAASRSNSLSQHQGSRGSPRRNFSNRRSKKGWRISTGTHGKAGIGCFKMVRPSWAGSQFVCFRTGGFAGRLRVVQGRPTVAQGQILFQVRIQPSRVRARRMPRKETIVAIECEGRGGKALPGLVRYRPAST